MRRISRGAIYEKIQTFKCPKTTKSRNKWIKASTIDWTTECIRVKVPVHTWCHTLYVHVTSTPVSHTAIHFDLSTSRFRATTQSVENVEGFSRPSENLDGMHDDVSGWLATGQKHRREPYRRKDPRGRVSMRQGNIIKLTMSRTRHSALRTASLFLFTTHISFNDDENYGLKLSRPREKEGERERTSTRN